MRVWRMLLVCCMIPVLTGCFSLDAVDNFVTEKNKNISDHVRNEYEDDIGAGKEQVVTYTKEQLRLLATDLSDNAKSQIENWLVEQELNKYGDPKETLYTGGTPLFDEATGTTIDRFQYILEQNPELINKFNLQK